MTQKIQKFYRRALTASVISLALMGSALQANAQSDWSGAYVGLHAGGVWHDASGIYDSGNPAINFGLVEPAGFAGGLHAGVNVTAGSFVFGLELDGTLSSAQDRTSNPNDAQNAIRLQTATIDLEHLVSARARLGYTFQNLMVFATAGIAQASWDLTFVDGQASENGTINVTKTGGVYGGGAEWAIVPNLTLRAEYLYYDVGNTNQLSGVLDGDAGDFITLNDVNVARVGVSLMLN